MHAGTPAPRQGEDFPVRRVWPQPPAHGGLHEFLAAKFFARHLNGSGILKFNAKKLKLGSVRRLEAIKHLMPWNRAFLERFLAFGHALTVG